MAFTRRISSPHWNTRHTDAEREAIIKALNIALAVDEGDDPEEMTEDEAETVEKIRDIYAEQWGNVFNDNSRHDHRRSRHRNNRYQHEG